jgi:hypothetical protein
MKLWSRRAVCCSLFVALASYANAQNQAVPADARALATSYVAAINARDASRILALYSAKSLACITPENRDFYQETMPIHPSDHVPVGYTVSVLPVNEGNLQALETMGTFPVKPLNELHIDYQQGEEESGTVIIYLARENGKLVADFPCATDAQVKKYHDEAPARKEFEAHTKALADAIQPPLRAELIAMLQQHKSSSATERYKAASGQDYRTSMFVIHDLQEQLGAQ